MFKTKASFFFSTNFLIAGFKVWKIKSQIELVWYGLVWLIKDSNFLV